MTQFSLRENGEEGEPRQTIQCPYHAWTCTLDGKLIGAPFMQKGPGFAKQDYALHRLAVAQRDGDIFINYLTFPNMLLSLHPDYVMFHTLWPQSAERTRVTCEWLFHPAAFEQVTFNPHDAIEFWDMTNRQDWHICEQSQQGIASRAYMPGPYSPLESIPAAWDQAWLKILGG